MLLHMFVSLQIKYLRKLLTALINLEGSSAIIKERSNIKVNKIALKEWKFRPIDVKVDISHGIPGTFLAFLQKGASWKKSINTAETSPFK